MNKTYYLDTTCIQDVSKLDAQVRLGQSRLGKVSSQQKNEEEIFSFKKYKEEYIKKYNNEDITIRGPAGYQNLTIKNGYLHNCISGKDIEPAEAKEVWGEMYQHYLATKNKNQKTA